MQQEFRRTLGVRAGIDQDAAAADRHDRCKRRAANAPDALDNERGRRQQCAGVPGGNKRVALAVCEHLQAEHHGRRPVLLDDLGRIGVHVDHIRRVGDLHTGRQGVPAPGAHRVQHVLAASDQNDLRFVFLCGL